MALVVAAGVALLGLVFISLGAAAAIAARLHSRPAGLIIVGALYVAAGILVAIGAGRGRSASRP